MDWTNRTSALIILGIAVTSIIGLVGLSSLFRGGTGYGMMGGGMMGGGWLVMLIPLLAVVFLIFSLVPGLSEEARPDQGYYPPGGSQPPYQAPYSSLDVLSQRYARGEISRDDYLRMRNDISAETECEEHC